MSQDHEPYKTVSAMVDNWLGLRAQLATYPKADGCFICGSPDRRVNVCGFGVCKKCSDDMER